MAVGVAFVSRVAKNFQDYFVNVIRRGWARRCTRTASGTRWRCPSRSSRTSGAARRSASSRRCGPTSRSSSSPSSTCVFTTLVGVMFVMIYAYKVHWSIAPAFLLTVPLLGVLSLVLSGRIKAIQKIIVAETTALAGATTESLRNIELVKSLGLAEQEVLRLNATTEKILKLELKKVRYIRSLSFIQGTCVNFVRTSILFLMLYLIFDQQITVGQFFSLLIYSFFIFGPLQELGTSSTSTARPRRRSTPTRRSEDARRSQAGELRSRSSDLREARVRRRRASCIRPRPRRRWPTSPSASSAARR